MDYGLSTIVYGLWSMVYGLRAKQSNNIATPLFRSKAFAMKIVNIHKTITADRLLNVINEKLDPLFAAQRQTPMHFIAELSDGAVEIFQREIYDGFLFRIELQGEELHITRSEHYVDDVNSLTIESILNEIFADLAKDGKVTLVLEG
jgi:hypothetical protein